MSPIQTGRLRLSERNQILLFLVVLVGALVAVWRFSFRGIALQKEENLRIREQLEKSGFLHQTREALVATVAHETEVRDALATEWTNTVERLAASIGGNALYGRANVLFVDYRVHLLQTRRRLDRKAEALGIKLSASELGMSEEVFSTDDPRRLMVQLQTVERLVDLALDRRIRRLVSVHPLDPVEHLAPDGTLLLEEFPVDVEFDIDFDGFYDLFRVFFEEGHVFVFKDIRITSGDKPDAPLRLRAVLSALVFNVAKAETTSAQE